MMLNIKMVDVVVIIKRKIRNKHIIFNLYDIENERTVTKENGEAKAK